MVAFHSNMLYSEKPVLVELRLRESETGFRLQVNQILIRFIMVFRAECPHCFQQVFRWDAAPV